MLHIHMADAVVSSVIDKLADLLIEVAACPQCGVQDQVESVQRELTRIQCFLKDADHVKQKSGDGRIRNGVGDISDVAYDVEDVIDTYSLSLTSQITQSGLMGCLRRHAYCFSDLKVRKELDKNIKKIRCKISESRSTYGIENIGTDRPVYVCEKLRERRRSSPSISTDDHDVIGLDRDISMLVGQLLDQTTLRRSLISIVGTGEDYPA